jgi:predicted Kef-type K+ transport protein
MDSILIIAAVIAGFAVKQIGLPPLVGYLAAGFALNGFDFHPSPVLDQLAELGITLMLFTIGLKLDLKSLLRPEVSQATLGHMGIITLLLVGLLKLGTLLSLPLLVTLDWGQAALIAFAASFSSTVCAVKIFEERGEMRTRHGQLTIAVLILQDIAAVAFLTAAADKTPSAWALLLILLPALRPLLTFLLRQAGHDELLPLSGFLMAIGGGALFELVGLKADFGALLFGIILSNQPKSEELAKALMSFKDVFLIGFFLSIGFTALPSWEMALNAVLLTLLLPIKAALFFALFLLFRLRARTALLTAAGLATYSEFGLIVAAVGMEKGWLAGDWLATIAMAVSLSFIAAAALNGRIHALYATFSERLRRFESKELRPEDQQVAKLRADVLIAGMGRVGTGAYDTLTRLCNLRICGIETNPARVVLHEKEKRRVIVGDIEDADFCEMVARNHFRLVMLALPTLLDMQEAARQLRRAGYSGPIASVARYEDERELLKEAGIDISFNFYAEAGAGFAEHTLSALRGQLGLNADTNREQLTQPSG